MKKMLLPALLIAALCGAMTSPAQAAKDKKEKKNKKSALVENSLGKFDLNLDGTLDSAEFTAMESTLTALKNLDKNGDGKLDDAERTAAQEALKAQPEPKKKKKKKDL